MWKIFQSPDGRRWVWYEDEKGDEDWNRLDF